MGSCASILISSSSWSCSFPELFDDACSNLGLGVGTLVGPHPFSFWARFFIKNLSIFCRFYLSRMLKTEENAWPFSGAVEEQPTAPQPLLWTTKLSLGIPNRSTEPTPPTITKKGTTRRHSCVPKTRECLLQGGMCSCGPLIYN